eukprot:c10706_g1_i2.p1 GENE.c10706_g1_i2~~c10706_g1_i2.p1  ORF type:complete len:502 (+),score=59.40 c10706_g1_i2:47-1552(+)
MSPLSLAFLSLLSFVCHGHSPRPDIGPQEKTVYDVTPRVSDGHAFLYHDYEGLTTWAQNISTTCSHIMKLSSIGKSVQGRELWVMRITKHPNIHEDKPEFLYVGNMHGDETVGREVLIHFVQSLCDAYNNQSWSDIQGISSAFVTQLVDSTDIHVLFSLNPDGFELKQRENARQIDLNRNFPDQFRGTEAKMQLETSLVIDFLDQHQFSLGSNLHGGDLLCNYPWDGALETPARDRPSISPDNHLYQSLCLTYSHAHATMLRASSFPNGITNGAEWYTVFGGLQDYSYVNHGMLHVTMELSMVKGPPESELRREWINNQLALYRLVERIHTGVQGYIRVNTTNNIEVLDTLTVEFHRRGASEEIERPPAMQVMRTKVHPTSGYFARVLLPGSYNAKVFQGRNKIGTFRVTVPEPSLDGSLSTGVARVSIDVVLPRRGSLPIGLQVVVSLAAITAVGLIVFVFLKLGKVRIHRYRRHNDPTFTPALTHPQETTSLRENDSKL